MDGSSTTTQESIIIHYIVVEALITIFMQDEIGSFESLSQLIPRIQLLKADPPPPSF
jgi:hypothetical protein